MNHRPSDAQLRASQNS